MTCNDSGPNVNVNLTRNTVFAGVIELRMLILGAVSWFRVRALAVKILHHVLNIKHVASNIKKQNPGKFLV